MSTDAGRARERRLARRLIRQFDVDLSGLVVLTEAASGPYRYTPILTALAGARHVHAVTRNSRHGKAAAIIAETTDAAEAAGVGGRVTVVEGVDPDAVRRADIVVNAGFVRPIDRALIDRLKPTAVIPLMWETWEWRRDELDLDRCRERGILVLGTDESRGRFPFTRFTGMAGLALLGRLVRPVASRRIVLLGAQPAIGRAVHAALAGAGAQVHGFARPDDIAGDPRGTLPYEALPAFLEERASGVDAIVVAEHLDHRLLIGHGGLVDPRSLARLSPGIAIAHMAGNVDAGSIRDAGLRLAPDTISPPGHMSFHAGLMGPLPVLHLFTAGLKVGERMARARLSGLDTLASACHALEHPLAMDFPPPHAWCGR